MKHKQPITRLVSLLLIAIMTVGVLTACGESSDDKATADSATADSAAADAQASPLLTCDKDVIEVKDPEASIETQLTITSEDAEIDGTIDVKDVSLKGAFKDMKIESVANDEKTVTLKLSGKPDMTRETYSIPVLGKVEFAGRFFGSEVPVETRVELSETVTGDGEVTTIFWPRFDSVLDNDDAWEMHIALTPVCGAFAEGFDKSAVSFSRDFEDAKLTSFEKNKGNYDLVLSVPKTESDEDEYRYSATVTLAKGSMVNRNGEPINEELSVSRAFEPETLGKVFTPIEIGQMKDIVGGFGNTTFGTISGIISGGSSAFSAGWMLLGLMGYVPNDASRHAEIMSKLAEIQDQLNEIQGTIDIMRGILDEHSQMLTDIGITLDEFYLNDVGGDMVILTSLMEEITDALKTRENKKAIETAMEEIAAEYQTPDGEEKTLDEDDVAELQLKLATKIGALPQSANYTIGDKIKKLKDYYDAIQKKFHTGDKSNPINAYIDLHKKTDNFATTSLDEKILYAEEIKYQLNRALVMLEALDGIKSHKYDRSNFETCIFPDPTVGVTDADGNPWCYPLNGYVRLSGGEIGTVYLPMQKGQEKVTFFTEEKANEFARRLQGRTCRDELLLAGFTEEQLDVQTGFSEADMIQNRKYNVNHAGLAFEYENWAINNKPCKEVFQKATNEKFLTINGHRIFGGYIDRDYLDYFASHLGTDFDDYFPYEVIGESQKENNTFAVVSRGLGWNDTKTGGYSVDATYSDRSGEARTTSAKETIPAFYKGWAAYYPKHYLIVVSSDYLSK